MHIGFIGQGYVGKNYADDFERRGFDVVRYSLEQEYLANKEKIKDCDIVFIAVPTPTTPQGFDASIVTEAVGLVGAGKTAVVKSTLMPGTTDMLQKKYPQVFVMHSPEFLSRGTAADDAVHPGQNIIGIPKDTPEYRTRAQAVLDVLPQSHSTVVSAETAELFKYTHNTSLFVRGVYMNLLFDLSKSFNIEWSDMKDLMVHDPLMAFQDPVVAKWHIEPVRKEGRGVGGDCHIKDFAVLLKLYKEKVGDKTGVSILEALEKKNIELLRTSGKDISLLNGVYGADTPLA